MLAPADAGTACLNGQVRWLLGIGAAVMLTVGSCASNSPPLRLPSDSSSESPQALPSLASTRSTQLDCGDYVGTEPPGEDLQVVLGVVALPTRSVGPALGTSATGDSSLPRLFAKTGLLVKAGVDVQISVSTHRAGDRLGIGWGSGATPSQVVAIHHCVDVGHSGWLAFAGGYWLDHPACVTLRVRSAGQDQYVDIGLGAPCRGQRPPQKPYDS